MRRGLAIALAAVGLSVTAAGLFLMTLGWGVPLPDSWGFRGFTSMFALAAIAVGLVIALNRPRHPIGWLMLVAGTLSGIQFFGDEYSIYSVFAGRAPLPGAPWMGWLNVWIWVPGVTTLAAIVPLYFPDGRLPSPRWRPVVWLGVAAMVFTTFSAMIDPLQIQTNMRGAPPPFDPTSIAGPLTEYTRLAFGFVGFPLMSLAAFLAALSVVRRFRRARGAERQQIKWFAFGALGVAVAATANVIAQIVVGLGSATYGAAGLWKAAEYLLIASMVFLIVSVGLAILRYRLYDVDVVINRTLVYGALSAVLAGTYVVSVVAFQTFVGPHVGGSEVGIAASTLITLALVQPLRRRIQAAVDRRFDRARYDAAVLLEAFSDRIGREVDLDEVGQHLLGAIHETMRPQHASVWLREAGR